jgi:nucleotide-binding universal stress UspA family protein
VWVVRPGDEGLLRSLLVPIDFSEVSARALTLGGSLAAGFGARLTVLHVLNFDADPALLWQPAHSSAARAYRKKAQAASNHRLRGFVKQHLPSEEIPELRLARGEPSHVINAWARRQRVDLVVMGTLARSGIPGFVMGNTAERVLRTCPRSFLGIKPEGFVSPVQPAVWPLRAPTPLTEMPRPSGAALQAPSASERTGPI